MVILWLVMGIELVQWVASQKRLLLIILSIPVNTTIADENVVLLISTPLLFCTRSYLYRSAQRYCVLIYFLC